MSCCVGCNKSSKGCSVGCMDYLVQSLVTPKEMKIMDNYRGYKDTPLKVFKKQHTYLGGNL